MYPNLEKEMKERNITRGSLANVLGRTPTTISFKLSGKAPITLREAAEIRDVVDKSLSIDYLFKNSNA